MGVDGGPRVDRRIARGRAGEDAALAVYLDRGFRAVARNWRCRAGEVDLILERDDLLVFCEVKTRRGDRLGPGFEAVTAVKRARLRRLAEFFLAATGARARTVRFDVASVAIGGSTPSALRVELFEDAF